MIGSTQKKLRAQVSLLGLGVAVALSMICLPLSMVSAVQAGTEQTLELQKAQWQDRYRSLLQKATRLGNDAKQARANYSRAQKRNYPRGGAKRQFLRDAEAAKKELVEVRQEIDEIYIDARRNGIPAHWLDVVAEEPISPAPPALPDLPATASEEDSIEYDRAGRNPLYLRD